MISEVEREDGEVEVGVEAGLSAALSTAQMPSQFNRNL